MWDQIVIFETPGLDFRSWDSNELRCKSRGSKRRIWSNSEGWLKYNPPFGSQECWSVWQLIPVDRFDPLKVMPAIWDPIYLI